jgi:hypothetical protein
MRFTSVEYTCNNFLKNLLWYVLYSVRLEFMHQPIADWPSRVWGGGSKCLHRSPASRKRRRKGNPVPGDINTGTWAPGWGSLESETVKCGHESCGPGTWEWVRWRGPAEIVNCKPILSSERKLHKDYDRRGLIEKKIWSWVSRGSAPRQLIGCKPPVVK